MEDIEADMAVEARLKQAREALRRGDREGALAEVRAGLAVKSTDGRLLACSGSSPSSGAGEGPSPGGWLLG